MNVKKDIRFRVYIAFSFICIMGLAVLLKAATIQLKEGKELRQMAADMHVKNDTVYAERGNIYSENGDLLCSSIPQFDLRIDFSVIKPDTFNKYIDTLAKSFAQIFKGADRNVYKTWLINGQQDVKHKYYFVIGNKIPYNQYLLLREIPPFNKRRGGGLIVEPSTKRLNPYGQLAFRAIGLWRENNKLIGLESTYDTVLKGQDGSRLLQKMTGNVWMPVQGSESDAENGNDIVTTLDLGIQNVAEHALNSVLNQYECLYGTCIVMETTTGKIRALANLGRQDDGTYLEDYNYALLPSEPGSTFKLATLLSLLNDGYIHVSDLVNCEGGRKVFGNRIMKDSHEGLGTLTIRDAYAHSSNVAMAKLAYQFYAKNPEKYIKHLEAFGLDKKTGIDLDGERRPRMIKPADKSWSGTTLPWMATGYGIMITPLHTCMLYNAIANGGKMMKPYLVSAIGNYGQQTTVIEPKVLIDNIGNDSTIAQLQSCMEQVVNIGTAKHIQSPHYGIAGKTGTAQVVDKIKGKMYHYEDGVYQGSFVGYFPTDKPKYTICVVIRTKPHSAAYYGGLIAAPVFRMIADRIFANSLGSWKGPLEDATQMTNKVVPTMVMKDAKRNFLLNVLAIKNQTPMQLESFQATGKDSMKVSSQRKIQKGFIPNVVGMGMKDAVYLLEQEGLRVMVSGSGKVNSQSLASGLKAQKGQLILITLT